MINKAITLLLCITFCLCHSRRDLEREFQAKLNEIKISYNSLIRIQNVYTNY